tara:strand:- start:34 stop:564 length:531 start_codon:yes stop_codon:yes gene_type:complete
MPNWTHNQLTITHKDADMIDNLMAHVRVTDELFNAIHPMPENTFRGPLGNEEEEMCQREGIPNWYDWCNKNWSTKWDAVRLSYNQHDDHSVTFDFDTAWSAPYGVYYALAEQGFEVEAYYVSYENWDAGEWHCDANGDVTTDDTINLNAYVPENVDEVFGVAEQLAEWEEEEKEYA